MALNNRPWVKALEDFPGLDFYIEGDVPLFNRRVNAAYLKQFSNNDSVHGRDHIFQGRRAYRQPVLSAASPSSRQGFYFLRFQRTCLQ